MQFGGLKINQEEVATPKPPLNDAGQQFLVDVQGGEGILDKVKARKSSLEDTVVYGVYDNSKKSFFERFNDFLIDRSKVGVRDKSYFFHMLAVMVDSGVPIVEALKVLAGYTDNVRFSRIINTVAHDTEKG
ncbi:type II secretion system F family protein, partial [Patescibacteria group bacterium]|nr:type II secretion system F family protein [Patescibacteria group bacterium]